MTDALDHDDGFNILSLLRTPFAMLDLSAPDEVGRIYASLDAIAAAIHARRKGRGLQITNRHLVWGELADEQRPSIRVDFFSLQDTVAHERLTVLAMGCDAAALMTALRNTNPKRKAA